MRISTFLLCDAIDNVQKMGNSVVPRLTAPQIALRPMFIPGAISFAIYLGITGMDLTKSNVIKILIYSPKNEIIHEIVENGIPATQKDIELPDEYNGCMLFIDIRNMVVMEAGKYPIKVFVNDNEIGSDFIPVFQKVKHDVNNN